MAVTAVNAPPDESAATTPAGDAPTQSAAEIAAQARLQQKADARALKELMPGSGSPLSDTRRGALRCPSPHRCRAPDVRQHRKCR